ncbi:MAG: hypothetical protein ACIWVG_27020 [Gloeotrichia echinulata HAB0833]
MSVNSELIQKILHLLRPLMETESQRRAYLIRALGINTPVQYRIAFNTPTNDFIPNLVNELVAYGETSSGKPALCALLEVIRSDVGEDVKVSIDKLLQQIRQEMDLIDNTQQIVNSPTPDNPLLVGIMVDVSWTMNSSIQNSSDKEQNRFEGFQEALHKLVNRAKELSQEKSTGKTLPVLKLFALGFGFGNLWSLLLQNDSGEKVRDLLSLPDTHDSTVTIDRLVEDWEQYEQNIKKMAGKMFGDTPMLEAFQKAENLLKAERAKQPYYNEPILFVISDGIPTDGSKEEVTNIAKRLREQGVIIISCYVTDKNVIDSRCLYEVPLESWDDGAILMFDCASIAEKKSPFYSYLKEFGWEIQLNGHLFAQINNSEFLSEFSEVIISPLLKIK